ncbi:MAG: HTH araC/xylS-type domain-containing protein [Oscillospiraceae bacterium]|jgi:AraC-like DNA-binding protein
MRYLACHERAVRGTFDFPIELYYVNAAHPRYEMPFHWHMECELILVLRGQFLLSLDGETVELSAGDSAFVPEGIIHGGTPHDCVYECIVFDMDRFLRDSTICRERYSAALGPGAHIQTRFTSDTAAGKLVDQLFEVMEKEQPGYEFITTGLLWQFIGTVLQQHLYTKPPEDNHVNTRALQIKKVLRRIREDYAEPLTLQQLAKEAGLAPQYFCRVFRQVTGHTPIDYLNYYRIECAAELLCATADSITQIALSCGFNDLSYFIRLFRRYKGVSPGEFRKQRQKE